MAHPRTTYTAEFKLSAVKMINDQKLSVVEVTPTRLRVRQRATRRGWTEAVATKKSDTIFKTYSNGLQTNRDDVVYDFSREALAQRMEAFIEAYNAEADRRKR